MKDEAALQKEAWPGTQTLTEVPAWGRPHSGGLTFSHPSGHCTEATILWLA